MLKVSFLFKSRVGRTHEGGRKDMDKGITTTKGVGKFALWGIEAAAFLRRESRALAMALRI